MRTGCVAICAGLLIAGPAHAAGLTCIAPPGTAATDEYCEQVVPPGHGDGRGPVVIAPAVARRLQARATGRKLLIALVPVRPGRLPRATGRSTALAGPATSGSSISFALLHLDTLGLGFVLTALVILAMMAAGALRARRGRAAGP